MNDIVSKKSNRIYLQWHLTNKCLNRCKHCYQDLYGGKEVSFIDACMLINDFLDCCEAFDALPVIALTGGDPMLNSNFWKILKEVRKQAEFDCVSVLGNPEQINSEKITKLKKFNLKHFQLSIDGMEITHDKIRYKGSFQKTINAIKDLSRNGIPVYVMSTISASNYLEMTDVMKIVYDYGATHWMFARWVPPFKGDCGISPQNYFEFIKSILNEHKRYEKRGYKKLRKEPLISMCQNDILELEQNAVSGGCGMGSSTISMLPDKTLMACRRHPCSIIGKWTKKRNFLYHFVNNQKMNKYREIHKIEGCRDCVLLQYCRGCRAAAYVATGKDFERDPQCFVESSKLNKRKEV